ncbi:MAG: hypothetical protein ABJA74_02370 [Lapillicoccus sp.]
MWLWVGMPFLSLGFGAVWAILNPVRWLHRGIAALARIPRDFTLTDVDVGFWLAAAGLLAFTWLELVAPDRTTLLVLRITVGLFVLVNVVGSLTFGERWFREGDPFEVLSRLYGQLAPLGRRPDGRLVLRTPVHGLSLLGARRGLLATAAVMLGGTAYDSLSADVRYAGWVQSTAAPELVRTATLLGVVLLVAGALHLAAAVSARLSGVPVRGVAADLAPSLLPIAAGYLVAHYYSLLVFQGRGRWRCSATRWAAVPTGSVPVGSPRGRGRSSRPSSRSSRPGPSSSVTCSASSWPTSRRSGSFRTGLPSSDRSR